MKASKSLPAILSTVLMFGSAISAATAETIGENLYKQHCATCHAIAKDALGRNGPSLYGIVGKSTGQMGSFLYSAEFKKGLEGKIWTEDLLDAWLANPQKIASGSYMMYRQDDLSVRKAIINYLKTIQ